MTTFWASVAWVAMTAFMTVISFVLLCQSLWFFPLAVLANVYAQQYMVEIIDILLDE